MIDELLKFNREFVKSKGYERFITNKYPRSDGLEEPGSSTDETHH